MKPYDDDTLEADLRAAIDAGDAEQIQALGAEVDRRQQPRTLPSLHSSALWYASVGVPVFPIRVGLKKPLPKCKECWEIDCPGPEACRHELCHGLKDATTDQSRVDDWWTRMPEANIGLATGHRFDVVDIDGPLGQKSRAARWDDIFGSIDGDSIAKVLTPRPGGMHIYVPPTGDGNAAGIVPGVDYRGIGGYVLAPPSAIHPGTKDHPGTYQFLGTPSLTAAQHSMAS